MKGKYYVELYDGDRRRSLCLRTDNYELACQRYAAGLKELRKKIRAEHEAAKPQERLAWWRGTQLAPNSPFRQLWVADKTSLGIRAFDTSALTAHRAVRLRQ